MRLTAQSLKVVPFALSSASLADAASLVPTVSGMGNVGADDVFGAVKLILEIQYSGGTWVKAQDSGVLIVGMYFMIMSSDSAVRIRNNSGGAVTHVTIQGWRFA